MTNIILTALRNLVSNNSRSILRKLVARITFMKLPKMYHKKWKILYLNMKTDLLRSITS